jgi:hypothetical protein
MESRTIRYSLSEQRDAVVLEISRGDEEFAVVRFTAAQLDFQMAALARFRSALTPPVSADPPEQLAYVLNPSWKVLDAQPQGSKTVLLRDPCVGWLGFRFEEEEAKAIAQSLSPKPPHDAIPRLPTTYSSSPERDTQATRPPVHQVNVVIPRLKPPDPARDPAPAHGQMSPGGGSSSGAWDGGGTGPGGGGGGHGL